MSFKFECPVCGSPRLYPYYECNISSLDKIVNYQCMKCFKTLQYRKQWEITEKGGGWKEEWCTL